MELILQSPHVLINTSFNWQTYFIKSDIQGLRQTLLWLSLRNWDSQRCCQSSRSVPHVLPSGFLFTKLIFTPPTTTALTDLALIGEKTDSIWSCRTEGRWGCLPHRTAMSGDPGTMTQPECAWPHVCTDGSHSYNFIPSLSSTRSLGLHWLTSPPQIPLLPHSDSSHGHPPEKDFRVLYSFYVQMSSSVACYQLLCWSWA